MSDLRRDAHWIETVRELKDAIAQFPDDARLTALLTRAGRPHSTLAVSGVRSLGGAQPGTVQIEVVEGQD